MTAAGLIFALVMLGCGAIGKFADALINGGDGRPVQSLAASAMLLGYALAIGVLHRDLMAVLQ